MEYIWAYSNSVFMAFRFSRRIIRFLGKKNFVIVGKIMGLILGVLGANMLIEGIKFMSS
jgi:multiple antibiotic resistance protein